MMVEFSKRDWKCFVNDFINNKNREDVVTWMRPLKKVDAEELENENFEMKPYMKNLPFQDALIQFRLRGKVLHTVKTHFKNDNKFKSELWTCEGCPSFLDTSHHILHQCVLYEDLRQDLDLENSKDIVTFFKRVLLRRENTDD